MTRATMPADPAQRPRPAEEVLAKRLADGAVAALEAEALLTPKPGLVDRRGGGSHADMDLDLLLGSATALRPAFEAAALAASRGVAIDVRLRERLGRIGRAGERRMLEVTGDVNTHRGALWSLGLLVAAAASSGAPGASVTVPVASRAALIARLPDRGSKPVSDLPGARARRRFRTGGAVGQAQAGFPHAVDVALPVLRRSRASGAGERHARLDALLAVMATLDDTCVLHRGGPDGLALVQDGAGAVLEAGGCGDARGLALLGDLDLALNDRRLSPGGSGDLLAVALFLDGMYDGRTAGGPPDVVEAGVTPDHSHSAAGSDRDRSRGVLEPGGPQMQPNDGGDECRS